MRISDWSSDVCSSDLPCSASSPSGNAKLAIVPMSTTTAMPTANHVESGLRYSDRRPVTASPSVTTARIADSPTPSQRVARDRAALLRKDVHHRSQGEGGGEDDRGHADEHARGEIGRAHV